MRFLRPGSVEVVHIGVEHALELLLMQDEQMVEALTSDTTEEALADRIRSRGMIRRFENLDATRLGNLREGHSKLTIVITDEVLRSHTIGGGFPKLLRGPSIRRRSCDAFVNHSARVQFDNEEGKQRAEEEIGDRKARRTPRSAGHACVRTCSTSALVAW